MTGSPQSRQHNTDAIEDTEAAAAFAQFEHSAGEPVDVRAYGNGHINDTFAVTAENAHGTRRRYILQRINTRIFRAPDKLMQNIGRVTSHLRRKLKTRFGADPDREALTLIPTCGGASFLRTPEDRCWRLYLFIEGATSHDVVQSAAQGYHAAKAYGSFQRMLADLPPPPLHETIPDFHHTPKRLRALRKAVRDDPCGRRRTCDAEVAYALSLADETTVITDGLASGELPMRVTHNDTKLNNVLLDDRSGEGMCVIDLDTVMPGSCLYDFGDLVRSAAGRFEENTNKLGDVCLDTERYRAIVTGYLSTAGGFITDEERRLLPEAGMLMTYETGIRFLTDYLEGDWYFKTSGDDENLKRARVQLMFVRQIREQLSELREAAYGRTAAISSTARSR